MPSLNEHQSNQFTKLLLVGDSKSGKTTSLASLPPAGFSLRILDFDNLLDGFKDRIMSEHPELAAGIEYRTLRDKIKASTLGPVLDGPATAFITAMKMLDDWKYDETNLGKPSLWGPECVLVVDSLSRLCDAAFAYHSSIAGPKADGRAVFFAAQRAVEMVLANLTSEQFRTNVIVIAHGVYMDLPDGTTKIFPYGVGQKLSPKIPSYFPVYVRYKNAAGKRSIQIESDVMIDLAMPKLGAFKNKTLPIEDGLATIFTTLRGDTPKLVPPKPKSLTLRRI